MQGEARLMGVPGAPLVLASAEKRASKLQEILELETFQREQLSARFQKIVKYRRLYLSQRDDNRKPHEKWRSNTVIPYAYSGAETKTAALCDILLASDPWIQAEGVGPEDDDIAPKIEAYLSYVLTKNLWPAQLDQATRSMIVDGTHVWKVVWVDRKKTVVFHPTPEEVAAFNNAVSGAAQAVGVPPPSDPAGFEEWRKTVNLANDKGAYPLVPEPPMPGPREVCEYKGPAIQRVNLFELRFDPLIEDWNEQPQIVQRVTRDWSWVEARTGPGKLFDEEQVRLANVSSGGLPEGGVFSQWEEEIASMLGLSGATVSPADRSKAEILEVFRPGDKECPYALILNRRAIANNNVGSYPFGHGMYPYVPNKNVPIAGHAMGMSDIEPSYRLYLEMNTLRDLRIDSITLGVHPVFVKKNNIGVPDIQKKLSPGTIIEASAVDALKRLTSWDPGLQYAFQEIGELKADIDESNSTPSHVRGGTVSLNRVSATEAERRFSQAIIRIKQTALRIESSLQPIVQQVLFLSYQFGDPESRVRAGGSERLRDPLITYNRYDFLKGLDYDFRFRGATRALNRELAAQQLQSFIQLSSQLQVLPAATLLRLLRRQYEALGLKGGSLLITDEDIKAAEQQAQQQQITQRAQDTTANDAAKNQAMETEQPVPDEVELQEQ